MMPNWISQLEPIAHFAAAGLMAFVAFFVSALAVIVATRAFNGEFTPSEGIPGHAWQGLLFAVILDGMILAGFGIGRWYDLFVNGWGAIVGIVSALFGGWLAYRAAPKVAAAMSGNQTVNIAKAGDTQISGTTTTGDK